MPLLDLSQVTETIIRLLSKYISQPHLWGLGAGDPLPAISITGDPPDLLAQQTNDYALTVYLYHIQEDAHHKNLPAPPGADPPVRFREMGLNLFYLLTASGGSRAETQPYVREQRLMGLAVKAFHDYPVLDRDTRIGTGADAFIFPAALRGEEDEFRLTLHPATLEELNKVWTAATVPMRLSTIYQVSVVLLEAEVPAVQPLPVLVPRIDAAPFQPLWLQSTESDWSFTLPGETRTRTVTYSSAQVAVGQRFRVLGAGFTGTDRRVFLANPAWPDPPRVEVTGWITDQHTETLLELEVRSPVAGRVIVPGEYQVYIQQGAMVSNFGSLTVAPVIDPPTAAPPGVEPDRGPAGSLFFLHGGPFTGGGIDSVEICLGPRFLSRVAGLPGPGEFRLVSASVLQAGVPADLSPSIYVIRAVVNGISTPPTRWFEVTA